MDEGVIVESGTSSDVFDNQKKDRTEHSYQDSTNKNNRAKTSFYALLYFT